MTYEYDAILEKQSGTKAQADTRHFDYDLTQAEFFKLESLFEKTASHHGCDAWIEKAQSPQDILLWAFDVLNHSPGARSMLEHAVKNEWTIRIDRLADEGYSLDTDQGVIYLDDNDFDVCVLARSSYLRHMLLMNLVRALRDQWHESFDDDVGAYTPDSVLMRERLITAEIETFAVQAAWELRSAGYNQVWRYMLGSQDGDLAMSLGHVLEHNPSLFMDGSALVHVIRQWFKTPGRIAAADHRALEYMDDILRRRDDKCQKPLGDRILNVDDISTRTTLPDGICYVGEKAHLVLADIRHYGLQNPVNKAHFEHVKHDIEACVIADVPFRDAELGHRIFAH